MLTSSQFTCRGAVAPDNLLLTKQHFLVLTNQGSFIYDDDYEDMCSSDSEEHVTEVAQALVACYGTEWPASVSEFDYEKYRDTYYLYASSPLTETSLHFLQWILRGLDADRYPFLVYEYAHYCPNNTPGSAGGGAYFITRDSIEQITTRDWVAERCEYLLAGERHGRRTLSNPCL